MNFYTDTTTYTDIQSREELYAAIEETPLESLRVENHMGYRCGIIEYLEDAGRVKAGEELEDDIIDLLFD